MKLNFKKMSDWTEKEWKYFRKDKSEQNRWADALVKKQRSKSGERPKSLVCHFWKQILIEKVGKKIPHIGSGDLHFWMPPEVAEMTIEEAEEREGIARLKCEWPDWNKFKSKIKKGDKIYSFDTNRKQKEILCSRGGYWIARNGKIVWYIVTILS